MENRIVSIRLAFVAALGLFTLGVAADPAPAFLLQLEYGRSSAGRGLALPAGNLSGADHRNGFGAALGWRSPQGLGVELAWLKLGAVVVPVISADTLNGAAVARTDFRREQGHSVAMGLTWTQPLTSTLDLTATAGVHRWRYAAAGMGIDGVDPAAGLRLSWQLGGPWQLGVGGQWLDVDGNAVVRWSTRLGYAF